MTNNNLRDMFEALGVQKPRGFSDMAKCELQELVIGAYGISVPEEVLDVCRGQAGKGNTGS